ncbi:hypothetical protein MRX96_015665 [Rhipicephalus microplus]
MYTHSAVESRPSQRPCALRNGADSGPLCTLRTLLYAHAEGRRRRGHKSVKVDRIMAPAGGEGLTLPRQPEGVRAFKAVLQHLFHWQQRQHNYATRPHVLDNCTPWGSARSQLDMALGVNGAVSGTASLPGVTGTPRS